MSSSYIDSPWNNKPFPVEKKEVSFLKLPDGRFLQDACIWENFMQDELQMDPEIFWEIMLSYPTHSNEEDIEFRKKGDNPFWVSGKHPALNYRGHAVKRNKMWCQRKYSKGMYKYGYTGWQHCISNAVSSCRKIPIMKELMEKLDGGLRKRHSQWIITKYKDGNDNIGFHSDKNKDFDVDSYFVVIKLGEPRKFEFRMKRTENDKNPKPFFSKVSR